MTERDATISLDYLDEIHEAFNRYDVDAIVDYFADDGVFQLARGPEPFGRRLEGKDEIRNFLTERFAAIKDMHWKKFHIWTSGNRAASEWVVTATLPGGDRLEQYGCDLYQFRGNKIVRKDTYWKSRDPSI